MDEINQTISVVEDSVVISVVQPPIETTYSREQLNQMIKDAQDRVDSNTSDLLNYKSMLALLGDEKPEVVIENTVADISKMDITE